MRILQLHVNYVEYEPIKKEIAEAEECEKKKYKLEDALLLLTCVEKNDNESVCQKAVDDAKDFMSKMKINKLLIYPFAHLSSDVAKPDDALKIVKKMEDYAKASGISTYRAPFGWNKALSLSVKGHPLAEQSRMYTAESVKVKEKTETIKKEYLILTEDGSLYRPGEYKFKKGEEGLKALVEQEALGMESPGSGEPSYIKFMKKFGLDWEPMADVGHMRFAPEAVLIFDLVAEYSQQLVQSLGFPVYFIKGSNMFNLSMPAIKEHAGLFGSRMYKVDVDKKSFVMRYAACFQQFSVIKDWQISYKNLPFGAFEIADSYRLEQSGELLLAFRMRKFTMPDLHVFCKDLDEAKHQFFLLHRKIYEEIKKLGRNYYSLYNLTSKDFFEKNKKWILELVKHEKKPVLLCFYPPGVNYYWMLNIEYNIIDEMGRPREIGTVQIDVGNSKRFGITYTDKDGSKKYPVILHSAIIGSVERWIYTVFDTAIRMKNPCLPLWLSPTQARICPVSDKHIKEAKKIAEDFRKKGIRADVDDRSETIKRKIRDCEVAWIPLQIVFGEKEINDGKLSVRFREDGRVERMSMNELVKYVKEKTKGYPFKHSCLPMLLSERISETA
jgi:threonyl-tRNA synthetase